MGLLVCLVEWSLANSVALLFTRTRSLTCPFPSCGKSGVSNHNRFTPPNLALFQTFLGLLFFFFVPFYLRPLGESPFPFRLREFVSQRSQSAGRSILLSIKRFSPDYFAVLAPCPSCSITGFYNLRTCANLRPTCLFSLLLASTYHHIAFSFSDSTVQSSTTVFLRRSYSLANFRVTEQFLRISRHPFPYSLSRQPYRICAD